MRLIAALFALFGAMLALAGCANRDQPAPVAGSTPAAVQDAPEPTPEDTWVLQLSTGGPVRIQLRPDKAPKHVERIKTLTRQGFYNGLLFHRVIDGFMAQGGDPLGTGEGGSDLPDLESEFNDLPHVRGVTSMARADDPNSANSQFFVMLMPTLRLDNRYTAFGRVLDGMEYVDALPRGEPPAEPGRIVRAWIEADGPNAPLRPAPLPGPAAAPAPPGEAAAPADPSTP
jgi:cyclophilin family peptidyl-prolyl cis-trans isomerase